MCNFIQREYECGCHRWIASRWCSIYTLTHKRCPPDVTHFEYVAKLCGNHKEKNQPPVPWENLIRRRSSNLAILSI